MALMARAFNQAEKFGAEMAIPDEVVRLRCRPAGEPARFELELANGERVSARSVVIASGVRYRRIDVPNLAEFEASSVHYWATPLEGKLCAAQEVALVGERALAPVEAHLRLGERLQRPVRERRRARAAAGEVDDQQQLLRVVEIARGRGDAVAVCGVELLERRVQREARACAQPYGRGRRDRAPRSHPTSRARTSATPSIAASDDAATAITLKSRAPAAA